MVKSCTRCKLELDTSKFSVSRHAPDGLQYRCIDCNKKERESRRESLRNYQLTYKFGITKEEHDEIFKSQNGCCGICNRHRDLFQRNFAVDHCHKTGKVRGLLCSNCNTAIGKLEDSVQLLQASIAYLEKYNG